MYEGNKMSLESLAILAFSVAFSLVVIYALIRPILHTNRFIKRMSNHLGKHPDDANAFFNRGLAYLELRKYQSAINDFSQAIYIDPEMSDAYVSRGNALLELEQYDKGLEDYNQAVKINPENSQAYYNRGRVFYRLNEDMKAQKNMEKAIQLDPGCSDAYLIMGHIYFKNDEYEQALRYLEEYTQSYDGRIPTAVSDLILDIKARLGL
jgi:tetratricopeptide (TPR) repeat protein